MANELILIVDDSEKNRKLIDIAQMIITASEALRPED